MGDAPVRLVAGLGNPGPRYAGTRHNAGRMAAEELARRLGAGRFAKKYDGLLADVRGPAGPLTILLPENYMNVSGESVGLCAGSLRIPAEQVLVLHDELDLPFGDVRGKAGGGHGGHNGLRSVSAVIGGGYQRIRMGIGRPGPEWRGDQADWVLARWTEPAAEVEALVRRAADMAEVAIADGMEAAVARFHAREPGARAAARHARRAARADEPGDGAAGTAEAAE